MNSQVRRYAAELAAAPELHRALGYVRACRELVAKLGPSCAIEDAVKLLDSSIRGLEMEIEDAPTQALADASDAHSDWLREQRETDNA